MIIDQNVPMDRKEQEEKREKATERDTSKKETPESRV